MSSDWLNMSLCEAARAIRRRRVSSVELTRACLEQRAARAAELNCFIAIEEDDALRARAAADALVKRGARVGPLHGVPLAHKDMFYRAGEDLDVRLEDPARLPPDGHRDGRRAARARRRDLARQSQHGGVRGQSDRPQRALGPLPQSVESRAHHRRLVERLGRRGRRRAPATARSAPTPAARSACPPPRAAWSASSPRTAA